MTIVNTNMGSMIAKASLASQNRNMEDAIEKLSSGLSI
jgi:flagellin-like hook-associated protein FlgL